MYGRLAAICLTVCGVALAEDPPELPRFERVYPVAPEEGAVTRERPVFLLGFDGVDPEEERRLRFKLSLEPDGDRSAARIYDQRERRSGWVLGREGQVVFRPPRPVPDGTYHWRAWAWNGVEWVAAGAARSLRVDTVPPAAVEGLEVSLDRTLERLVIEWDPVTLDRDGGPEYVRRYHVHRHELDPRQPPARIYEIGVVESPRFEDRLPTGDPVIVFYRVSAEDLAGNISGRRD